MPFSFNKCFSGGVEIAGLFEIQPKVFGDPRGYFFEVYSEKDFFAAGLTMKFVQDNQSASSKGVLRGLHFQTALRLQDFLKFSQKFLVTRAAIFLKYTAKRIFLMPVLQ